MSTSRSRLNRAIQQIAEQSPEIRRAIEATKPRGDQPSAAGVGTSDAERDRVCCDGSTSDNPNPGADTRDTSEGGQGGLNADDPALLDIGPGSLTGVTDCATGQPVCFDGAGFIPPEGWDGPNEPPPIETTDTQPTCKNIGAIGNEVYFNGVGKVYKLFERCSADAPYNTSIYEGVDNCIDFPTCNAYFPTLARTIDTLSEPPLADQWPSDGCVNLAIKNGSIVGSKYDPENDGSYSKPMSEIELCDEFGNSFFLSPASNGGWKTIDATKDAGYLWGSNGQKIAHINGNEYSDPDI